LLPIVSSLSEEEIIRAKKKKLIIEGHGEFDKVVFAKGS
jgi:hypothetical protein